MASRPQETWVCGPAAGKGHYVSGCCSASFMGYPIDSGVILHARRLLSEEALLSILGDTVYLPFAEALAQFAWDRLLPIWRSKATYGSFYSGGVDAFAAALRRLLKRVDVIFMAELLVERRELLEATVALKMAVISTLCDPGARRCGSDTDRSSDPLGSSSPGRMQRACI